MRVPRPHYLTARLIGIFMLGASVLLCPDAPFAAEGPALPPAEYKPLPVGTKIRYGTEQHIVQSTDGFKTVFRTSLENWYVTYGLFLKEGDSVYQPRATYIWTTEQNEKSKAAIESLWPLRIGNKVELSFQNTHEIRGDTRNWSVALEVVRTEDLKLDGLQYPTYVVQEHTSTDKTNLTRSPIEYKGAHWYHPGSGVILKSETEHLLVASGFEKWNFVETKLTGVSFPEGTTTHALKGTVIPKGGSDPALMAELERLKREAEKTRKAETARQIEIALLKKEAEEARLAATGLKGDKVRLAKIAQLEKEVEQRHWDSVKDKQEMASVQDYLKRYPEGRYVAEAKARVAVLQRLASASKIDFGTYHALVIGIDSYKYLPKLQMAVNDAKEVAKVLKDDYGFKVTLLIDPNRTEIIDVFDELQETLTGKDNLLIYYAGHGWLNEDVNRGYWLPANAKPKRRSGWISNATITDTLKGLSAKHVMVVADSCYSGTLVRAVNVGSRKRTGDYWQEMASKWARVAITSGGLEPVADKGGGDNSPFAKAFIDTLGDNRAVMDGTTLFSKMRRPVMVNANQTPRYSDVRGAGHDGGDFLFVRKR